MDTCHDINGIAETCRSKDQPSSPYAAEANDNVGIAISPDKESSIDPRASFMTDEIRRVAEQERGNKRKLEDDLEDRAIDLERGLGSSQQDRGISGHIESCVSDHAPTILLVREKLLTPKRHVYAPKYASFLGELSRKEETGGGLCVNLSSRKVERKNRTQCQRYEIDRVGTRLRSLGRYIAISIFRSLMPASLS